MGETIYIDHGHGDGPFSIIFAKEEVKIIQTGLEVLTEKNEPVIAEVSRLCGIDMLLRESPPEPSMYSVPCLEVFASDGRDGWFACTTEGSDGPVYYIDQDRTPHLASGRFIDLLALAVSDPDWRRKCLPGGPWPRLLEDPEARKKLSETLRLPAPPPEELHASDALPRIFASRAEAEKEFPIQDIWNVLRQDKEPRFQVHQMMSPADREGRAQVHYTAWRETYAGLMPETILEAQTLERCRSLVNDRRSSSSTFVALDRENGDRVVGFGVLSRRARDLVSVPKAGEIVALYVLREFQGLGIGKQLLERCLAWSHRPKAVLFVLEGNEQAIGFYEHMGFRRTGHEVTWNGTTELEMVLEREAT